MWHILFASQPEVFSTINLVTGFIYHGWFVTLVLGLVFLLLVILAYGRWHRQPYWPLILAGLIAACWLPLLVNHLYNNWQDFLYDIELIPQTLLNRRHLRLCNLEANALPDSTVFCQSDTLIQATLALGLPVGKLYLAVPDNWSLYFVYLLYPSFSISQTPQTADYILVDHFNGRLEWRGQHLFYQSSDGVWQDWGQWQVAKEFTPFDFILSRPK